MDYRLDSNNQNKNPNIKKKCFSVTGMVKQLSENTETTLFSKFRRKEGKKGESREAREGRKKGREEIGKEDKRNYNVIDNSF